MTLRVTVTDTLEGLEKLAAEWSALQVASEVKHVLMDHRFIASWYEQLGSDKEMHVLSLHSSGDLVGIAPLVVSSGLEAFPDRGKNVRLIDDYEHLPGLRWRRVVPIKRLTYPLSFAASNIHGHPLLVEKKPEYYRAIFEYALEIKDRWDLLSLDGAPPDSVEWSGFSQAGHALGLKQGLTEHSREFYAIELPKSFAEFMQDRSRSFRRWVKREFDRTTKAAHGLGAFEIRSFRGDQIELGMKYLFELEKKSWKVSSDRRRDLHLRLDERNRGFHWRAACRFAENDEAQVLVGFAGNEPLNALYTLESQGQTNGVLIYQANQYAREFSASPIIMSAIERAIENGLTYFDLNGNNTYLNRYANSSRTFRRLTFYQPTGYSRLLGVVSNGVTRAARLRDTM